jgi:hypothetical protein
VKTAIRAFVFRTPRLKETEKFYRDTLGLPVRESSPKHFLIYANGIRIVFMETEGNEKVELYLSSEPANPFCILEDPNQIKVIIT